MIFQVTRTSRGAWSDKPPFRGCERHEWEETIYNGEVKTRVWWSIEINTLEELVMFGDADIVIHSPVGSIPDDSGVDWCIELYDGYRE